MYLGRATSLRSRVGSYFIELHNRPHLRRMVPQIDRIEALVVASVHEAAWLERNLHHRSLPRWNRIRGGTEVPQVIELDDAPGGPRLSVVHLGDRRSADVRWGSTVRFGPYLGGLRVRTAVSGLHRVWPVGSTGTRLTGSEQDMAAVRGVSPADRARLVAVLIATLERDPEAVASTLAELARRRDQASAELRFEAAGRLLDEARAVEWVTSVQRVSALEPIDAELAGWSDGVLLTLQIRAGRLDGWAQRRCGAEAADRRVRDTAQPWRDLTRTNVELAARLLRAR